jgi:DNA repair exonuclease SbcCD ATPase subunit
MKENENTSKVNQDAPEMLITSKVEEAVEDAQYLVAYAAKAGNKDIDEETVKVLVEARNAVTAQEWSSEIEVKFWSAYKKITNDVSPVTVDSVKALYPSHKSGLSSRFGRSKARRTVNIYTIIAVAVLTVLLILQIYWVVGSTLTTKLAGLLQRETELTAAINEEVKRYTEIELRFKINEANQEGFQSGGTYAFYSIPDWHRDTLDAVSEREKLETELDTLKQRLDRNAAVLLAWHKPLSRLSKPEDDKIEEPATEEYFRIQGQITAITDTIALAVKEMAEDETAKNEIAAKNAQLEDLLQKQKDLVKAAENESSELNTVQQGELIPQIASLESWLNEPDRAALIIEQRQQNLNELNKQYADLEHQLARQKTREESRRAILTAEFVLIVLQSYFLPLLYGLLGATAFILRSLARDIKAVTYSRQSDINFLLRLSLGSLAGLVVGWFIFLLPSATFLSSVSPLAIAFLVGYNIEILFSLMDKLIESLSKTEAAPVEEKPKQTTSSPSNPAAGILAAGD